MYRILPKKSDSTPICTYTFDDLFKRCADLLKNIINWDLTDPTTPTFQVVFYLYDSVYFSLFSVLVWWSSLAHTLFCRRKIYALCYFRRKIFCTHYLSNKRYGGVQVFSAEGGRRKPVPTFRHMGGYIPTHFRYPK